MLLFTSFGGAVIWLAHSTTEAQILQSMEGEIDDIFTSLTPQQANQLTGALIERLDRLA